MMNMDADKKYISFTIINSGKEQLMSTYEYEYRNLMALLKDKLCLEDFGECGGMGRCATCMVEVSGLKGRANTMKRNEETSIRKTGLPYLNIRLSCQILINEDLEGAVVNISYDLL